MVPLQLLNTMPINDIWKMEDGTKKILLSPFVINGVMTKPSDKNRKMPFYLIYPARYKEQLEINMPEDWPIKGSEERVQNGTFDLHTISESIGNKVLLTYEYENLKDHVMPDDASVFFSNYDYAAANTGFQVTYRFPSSISNNVTVSDSLPTLGVFPKLFMVLAISVIITFLVRRQRAKAN